MWTEEEFIKLEQTEHDYTLEALAIVLLALSDIKEDVQKELSLFYQKYGTNGTMSYQAARKHVSKINRKMRITLLYLAFDKLFDFVFKSFESNFKKHLTTVIKQESKFFGVDLSIDDLLDKTWGLDESNWYSRLWKYRTRWDDTICNDLVISLLKQENITDILKNIDKRFETMDTVLNRLWVSETSALRSLARKQIFKELGVNYFRFYTKVDERRCDICGSLHGRVFPMSAYSVGSTAPPIHTNCRCWVEPIME